MITGNPEKDFFEQNPELKQRPEFQGLLKNNSKSESSKIMWSVYFLEDPSSKFYNIPYEQRIKDIQEVFNPDFDPEERYTKEVISVFPRVTMSKKKIMYKIQMDAMDSLTAHLKVLQESIDEDSSFNKLVKVMEKLNKMWEGLDNIESKFLEEEHNTQMKGGAKKSAREKRRDERKNRSN